MRNGLAMALVLSGTVCGAIALAGPADDAAEEAVKKLDGNVVRNQQLPDKPVVSIMLSLSKVQDGDLKQFAGLKTLKYLALYNTQITDATLKDLAPFQLETLDVMKTKITDAGLKDLAAIGTLETLALAGNPLTGEGLKDLAALKKLRKLDLRETKITDESLAGLAGLTALSGLDLGETAITGTGLKGQNTNPTQNKKEKHQS